VRVAQDQHQVLVSLFDHPIETLEGGVELPEAEMYVREVRRKSVAFGSLKLLQHGAAFPVPAADPQSKTEPSKERTFRTFLHGSPALIVAAVPRVGEWEYNSQKGDGQCQTISLGSVSARHWAIHASTCAICTHFQSPADENRTVENNGSALSRTHGLFCPRE
jgi:hypothetical protein